MAKKKRKPNRQMIVCALAAAIAGASAVPFFQTMTYGQQQAQQVAETQEAATKPAGVPGEPGEAPKPRTGNERDPGGLMERAADSGAQVYVDDSFASVEQLRTAIRYANQGQNKLAIAGFQKIINEYGQKLVYLNNDSYVSITDYVREKLLAMPAVKEGMYDQMYGTDARKDIDTALSNRDLAGLIRICDRYFPATASLDGLQQAAEWYFERGEFAGAARTWQLLMMHPMASTEKRANFLFRAAVAESLAGNKGDAKLLRDRLAKEFPNASGPVDGKDVTLTGAADEVLALPAMMVAEGAADEWPAFQGGPAHSKLLTVDSSVGARLWSVDLNDEAISGEKNKAARAEMPIRNRYGQQQAPDPNYQALNSYPVLSNGTLFVHTGERIVALSVNAGTLLWAYPERPIPRMDAQQQQQMMNMYGGMMHGATSHDSATISGDQVFATLPARPAPAESGGMGGRRVYMYGMQIANTRIACLNRITGAEVWSTSAHTVKLEKAGSLSFIGSPIVTQQGVFSVARKAGDGSFTELYLVRLDRDTGTPTWACYLCSASSGSYYQPAMNMSSIPIPTIVDDVVYLSTGQGADCAVDANAGRILWLQITESAKQLKDPNQMYNPTFNTTPSWKFNPPLVSGDKLLTCETSESDALLRIYNRWSGKVLRSIKKKDLGMSSMDVLAGIMDSTAIVIGSNITGIDINATGKDTEIKWTVDFPSSTEAGKPQGRPFLSNTGLYIPFEKGMLLVDPRHEGRTKSFWQWPKTEKDVPGKPGNLLVTSEQVIVQNDTEVAGYSKWETARDNRLAKIKEHPTEPEAYLALAEISFRTNHFDLAEENMKKAVELANGAAATAEGAPEIIGRLYRTNLNFAEQLLGNAEPELRDRARFYYEQCRIAARDAEQQAEWRLCMSELSLAQKKPEEAAMLYNQILTDPNLRNARYRREDALARAGVTAEDKFRALIQKDPNGPAVYKRYEDQAAALLNNARAAKDQGMLSRVIEGYPNSAAAIAAASDLATAARESKDPAGELKALYWLLPRASGEKRAEVTADTAMAYLALPKARYGSAIAWTERGLRQFKDFSWIDPATKEKLTFAALREKLRANPAAVLAEGRAPVLPAPSAHTDASGKPEAPRPNMDEKSVDEPLAVGSLLSPIEQGLAFRRPDLLFVLHAGSLHIFDTLHGKELTEPQVRTPSNGIKSEGGLTLPDNEPTVLVGCVGDIAVLAQGRTAIGINVKNPAVAWKLPFSEQAGATPAVSSGGQRAIRIRQQLVVNGNGMIINNGMVIDPQTGQVINSAAADPEMARQVAFATLGRPSFNTLRLIGDKLVSTSGDKLFATNVTTGKPVWTNAAGEAMPLTIPAEGTSSVVLGNEDVIIVQVDSPTRAGSTYVVFDSETGKFRKQFKLQDDEHAQWRAVSDDGIFFVVSDRAVAAYDLFNDNPAALWRRTDLKSKYPNASILTLDGLVFINGSEEIMCLSAEGGEVRWPTATTGPVQLTPPGATPGQAPFLRSALVGDMVIYQSGDTLEAYTTPAQTADHVWWKAQVPKDMLPPLQSFQVSDPYIVALASGPLQGTQRSVSFVFYDSQGGRMRLKRQLIRSADDPAREGPMIKSWHLADNGIAMEVNGSVYFYRGQQ